MNNRNENDATLYDDYNDSNNLDNFGCIYSYSIADNDRSEKETKTRLSEEEEKKIIKESTAGKISGKLTFSERFATIDLYKEMIDKPYYTKQLSRIKFLEDNMVEFNLGSCDPYDLRKLYRKRSVKFYPNEINCLIGCNGSGKSTILGICKDIIKENGLMMISYNNMQDGGSNFIEEDGSIESIGAIFSIKELSEGEQILNASSKYLDLLTSMVKGNIKRDDRFRLFRETDHIFVLLDAIDSGYSIDNIYNLVYRLKGIIKLAKENNKFVYIIAAANSYELTRNNKCWDVQLSKEVMFKDYDDYRKRIIETRAHIIKQWSTQEKRNMKIQLSSGL